MENVLRIRYRHHNRDGRTDLRTSSVGLVRYADDFVVFCHTKEEAEAAKRDLTEWLMERGLHLSQQKTRIIHLEEGFDFLGCNVRWYRAPYTRTGHKVLIKPSKKSVQSIRRKLNEAFRSKQGCSVERLIRMLNPLISGWTNYFRAVVAATTFQTLDNQLFDLQVQWTRRRHSGKSWSWRQSQYWGNYWRNDRWVFGKSGDCFMRKFSWTHIKRHVLVQRFASWDDPALERYWDERMNRSLRLTLNTRQRYLAERQDGKCPRCGDHLLNQEGLEIHHVVQRKDGGTDNWSNLQLLHLPCHRAIHGGAQPTNRQSDEYA